MLKRKKMKLLLFTVFAIAFLFGCSNNYDDTFLVQGRIELNETQAEIFSQSSLKNASINNDISTAPIETAFYNPQEYIIKFNQAVEKSYIKNTLLDDQAQQVRKISKDMYKVSFKNHDDNSLLNSLQENNKIEYIEPDYLIHVQSTTPNDPAFSQQWNLEMLNLKKTWSSFQGSSDITVAVIDTGILLDHPDLHANIVEGYDFVDNDFDPIDSDPDFSHGTHVAGIIGAMTDNNEGIAGINWDISIMPIRVIGPGGSGGYSALIAGIYWAVDNGADVINLSLAGSVDSKSLRDAVRYAVDNNVTVVAASGNNGSSPILYPARYPEVISVGAIGPDKKRAFYSNYGPELDVVAPGGNSSLLRYKHNTILSTAGYMTENGPVHEYSWSQGTSMATPHVSGLIALLYSTGINDPTEIRNIIKDSADKLGSAQEYGAGLININRALGIEQQDSDNNYNDNSNNKINIIAINNKNGAKKISSIDNVNKDFTLALEEGSWDIFAEKGRYNGLVRINVPEEKNFIIQLKEDLK
ncbi:S8 family peptidase [Natronospora cellulosivora (SeqCode)]